jgi:hypothetical protein
MRSAGRIRCCESVLMCTNTLTREHVLYLWGRIESYGPVDNRPALAG